jgi:hypothetical protein
MITPFLRILHIVFHNTTWYGTYCCASRPFRQRNFQHVDNKEFVNAEPNRWGAAGKKAADDDGRAQWRAYLTVAFSQARTFARAASKMRL